MSKNLHFVLYFIMLSFFINSFDCFAQKTVQFRISVVGSDLDDELDDGAFCSNCNPSDPQWDYKITDMTFGPSGNGSTEISNIGSCPVSSTLNDNFFSEVYDCDISNNFRFVWSAFEDDAFGTEANTGTQTVSGIVINPNQSTWTNAIPLESATGSDVRCGGGSTITWTIQLQYRVLGTSLCKDECIDPYVLPTAAEFECQTNQTVTPLSVHIFAREPADATEPGHFSDAAIASECGASIIEGASPEEVWVRTTIPDSSGGVVIQFTNHGECTGVLCQTNVSYAWYTSSNGLCSGLEYRGCDAVSCFIGCGNGEIKVDGRAGEDVWVRIWEEDDQGFHIEINQIKPSAPADKCYTAMPLSPTGCNYQATAPTTGAYAEPDIASWVDLAHPDLNPDPCGSCICQDGDGNSATNTIWSSNENMVWFTFNQAATGPFDITVLNMSCIGGANTAQLGVFTNSGTPQSPSCDLATETGMGCSVGVGTVTLNINSLPAGEYILVVDGNAGAECDWTFQSNTLLAMILYDFKASYNSIEDAVDVQVEIRTDADRLGITIERSADGINFMDADYIPSQFNAAEGAAHHSYTFSDENYPLSEVAYYRLREESINGSFEYSNIRAVSMPVDKTSTSVLQAVYPNPAHDVINIPFLINSEEQLISAAIFDIQGRMVLEIADNELYQHGKHKLSIDVAHLPKGVYTLRFTANNATSLRKIVLR